ncbi:hypothetical protein FAGKG844_70009 [Frankia sp. AgKG'84/4]
MGSLEQPREHVKTTKRMQAITLSYLAEERGTGKNRPRRTEGARQDRCGRDEGARPTVPLPGAR